VREATTVTARAIRSSECNRALAVTAVQVNVAASGINHVGPIASATMCASASASSSHGTRDCGRSGRAVPARERFPRRLVD